MKKICPECGKINDYNTEVCSSCGCALDVAVKYKLCPNCGKKFDGLNRKKCDECGFELIVCGRPAAQVFDEGRKSEIPAALRVVCILLPFVGLIIAAAYAIIRRENGELQPETAKTFLLTTVTVQLVLIGAAALIAMLLSGSSFSLMKNIFGE